MSPSKSKSDGFHRPQLAASNMVHFLNESAEYRTARNALLAEEIELRRHLERVAAHRRALPLGGGGIPHDFQFFSETGPIQFSSLFGDKDEEVPRFGVFSRRYGTVRHFCSGEMSGVMANPGHDLRGAPDADPLWQMLDLTSEGRGTDWYPKLDYKTSNSK